MKWTGPREEVMEWVGISFGLLLVLINLKGPFDNSNNKDQLCKITKVEG